MPKWADRMIRLMYLESFSGNTKIKELIERLTEVDRAESEKQVFRETKKGSGPKAA